MSEGSLLWYQGVGGRVTTLTNRAVLGGEVWTSAVTEHCHSNIYVAERILGRRFAIDSFRITAPV